MGFEELKFYLSNRIDYLKRAKKYKEATELIKLFVAIQKNQ